ncbi:hypothetical protein IFM89_004697 [Coptis chinensis]|uniref:SAP30-binding protein n=1 Tax=Coptis chinensis TaxID=261450 RepID=A0A835GUC5_9MAGN|nr:hypothetical protein IFM89_004697 [Coptis chinensis]
MASKKKSEGIALLSMYNDYSEEEDEEMEDIVHSNEQNIENSDNKIPVIEEDDNDSIMIEEEGEEEEEEKVVLSPSPLLQIPITSSPPLEVERVKKRSLAIVDYGHDETAMSPEPEAEEGEIMSIGHVMVGEDIEAVNGMALQYPGGGRDPPVSSSPINHDCFNDTGVSSKISLFQMKIHHYGSHGNVQGKTPPATSLTPNIQASSPQTSEQPEPSESDNGTRMTYIKMESETTVTEETIMVSVEIHNDADPLENFLPPPPKTMCSEELQEKINKFLALKSRGKSFNAEVRNRKDYRNPDFLLHAVRYQEIDQIGSCFSKDVFDPHGYDKSDYYEAIDADIRRELERKEQERKRSQRLDFVVGAIHPGVVAPTQNINMQRPAVPPVASTGSLSLPTTADSVARDSRQSKRSKWDKVDGDRKNPLHIGGQDAISAAAAQAAALSASVGAGYTAFAIASATEHELGAF